MKEPSDPIANQKDEGSLDTHVAKVMIGTWITIIFSLVLVFLIFYGLIKAFGGRIVNNDEENAKFSKEYEKNMEKQQQLEKMKQSWK